MYIYITIFYRIVHIIGLEKVKKVFSRSLKWSYVTVYQWIALSQGLAGHRMAPDLTALLLPDPSRNVIHYDPFRPQPWTGTWIP